MRMVTASVDKIKDPIRAILPARSRFGGSLKLGVIPAGGFRAGPSSKARNWSGVRSEVASIVKELYQSLNKVRESLNGTL